MNIATFINLKYYSEKQRPNEQIVIRIGKVVKIIINGVSYKLTFNAKLILPKINNNTFNIEKIANIDNFCLTPITVLSPKFNVDIKF